MTLLKIPDLATRLMWWARSRIFLWRWSQWLKRIYQMDPSAALVEITRYRWFVMQAGYSEKWEDTFLRALAITEEATRKRASR